MARPVGSKNADYEAKREALSLALVPRLLAEDGPAASFRDLADAAGVSVPTLRHYFGDRPGVLAAALHTLCTLGRPHLERSAAEDWGPAPVAIRRYLLEFHAAWEHHGVGRVVSSGIAAGLHDALVGPACVNEVLEPTLEAAERRIAAHIARGELDATDVRYAALALLSPVILALLHQGPLSGASCRPLDVAAFLEEHATRFLRAFAVDAPPIG